MNAKPDDPAPFAAQVAAVCDLYPQAAARQAQAVQLMSPDAQTGLQALKRAAARLPMQPGGVEPQEEEYLGHATQGWIANFEVASRQVVAPSIGASRNEEDCAAPIAQTTGTDPAAKWIVITDQLHTHPSASLGEGVAREGGIAEELGKQGPSGVLKSRPTRAAFLSEPTPRRRLVYSPKHTSWLNPIELWFSLFVRRLLKRSSFTSSEELKERILAFIEYFNQTMAKPFKWTYSGRPLTA